MTLWQQMLIACPLIFLAGFVDSIAGGGGLISLPAYYMAGLPPHLAMGSNKFSSGLGAMVSTTQYVRGKCLEVRLVPVSILCALIGSFIGAQCALFLDELILKKIMVVLVPLVAVVTVMKKDFLKEAEHPPTGMKAQVLTAVSALVIGWYDGFFGPGTGMFLMLAFIGILGLDPVTACGNTKVVNLSSNIAAFVAFGAVGKVSFALAVPCALFSIVGNFVGSRLAMKRGVKAIKPIMLIVIALLLLSVGKDVAAAYLAISR